MKKLLIITSVAALLFQSCSTGNMFSHKRYGHLNWIDHNTKVETKGNGLEEVTNIKTEKQVNQTLETKAEIEINSGEQNSVETSIVTETPAQTNLVQDKKQENNSPVLSDNVELEETVKAVKIQPSVQQMVEKATKPASPKADEMVLLIVCLILCLIIPPLAMYLWNQTADSWFIIDLVLFLCWIFFVLGYAFGLAALASIVIAFLRVLDII